MGHEDDKFHDNIIVLIMLQTQFHIGRTLFRKEHALNSLRPPESPRGTRLHSYETDAAAHTLIWGRLSLNRSDQNVPSRIGVSVRSCIPRMAVWHMNKYLVRGGRLVSVDDRASKLVPHNLKVYKDFCVRNEQHMWNCW
jgi:hypothetical protein